VEERHTRPAAGVRRGRFGIDERRTKMGQMRFGVVLGVVVMANGLAAGDVEIGSTFDVNDEGWGSLNDSQNFQWDGGIGNPGGAIRAHDVGAGSVWYFSAPATYLGDLGGAYGQLLSWDLLGISGNHTTLPDRADVMLSGAGMTVGINVNVQPVNGVWTSWEVTIGAGDWRVITSLGSGELGTTTVSEAQMRAVLSELTALHIRGEYTNTFGDRMALDNVRLVVASECPADLAEPFGVLNFFDVAAYLALYNSGDAAADLAEPTGVLNFFDVSAFLASYNAGCP
jgi:hypothetical protein